MTSPMVPAVGRAQPDGEYDVVVSWRALLFLTGVVVATLVVLATVDRSATVFALLAAAATSAVVAGSAVRRLSKHLPRGAAIVAIMLLALIGFVTLLAVVAHDLSQQEEALRAALHQAIADLPAKSGAARVAEDLHLDARIDSALSGLGTRLVLGDNDPVAIAELVGKVVIVAVLAAFMVAGGRRVVAGAVRFIRRASIREQVDDAVNSAILRSGAFVRRTLAVSMIHGLVAGLVARMFDLPGPISLGTWVAMMSSVPILGAVIGWLPVVLIGWANDVSLAALVVVAVTVIVIDRFARHRWVHRALHVGPLLTLLGIASGLLMMGVIGAVVGLLAVAFVAAILTRAERLGPAVTDLVDDPIDRSLPTASDIVDADEGVAVVGERRDDTRIVRLRLSTRTTTTAAVLIVGAAVFAAIAGSVQSLIVWLAVAGFIAAGLDRPITAVNRRWRVPRVAAIAMMLGTTVVVVVGVILIGGPSITNSTESIARDAPETVRSMESLPLIGNILERNGAAGKVEEFLNSVPARLEQSDLVGRIARAVGDGLVSAFWIVSLMMAILWDGPRLVRAVRERVPVAHRRRAIRVGRAAYTAVSNVVAAAAFVAALNGSVVMSLAIGLGIPLAPILGLWAAFWNFIPQIGGFVGAVPLVALGFAQGPWQGLIALGVFVVYQTFENHVIQPFVGSRAVHLPPLVVMIGALFGGAIAGFVGALMAGPALGVAKIAIDEFSGDRERIEDRVAEPRD